MKICKFGVAGLLPLLLAGADNTSARDNLIGTWEEDSAKSPAVWVVEVKGDAFHIAQSQGDQKRVEVTCTPTGAECMGTDAGKKVKFVMYYNGPTLVQIETAGTNITRRRFTVRGEPNMMDLEETKLSADGKPEMMHLKRKAS